MTSEQEMFIHNAAQSCELDPDDCYFLTDMPDVFCVTLDSLRHAKGLALYIGGEYRLSLNNRSKGHYEVFKRNLTDKNAPPRL
jgi:hypothetical protein